MSSDASLLQNSAKPPAAAGAAGLPMLQLDREPKKSLTPQQELILVRQAFERTPSAEIRQRLCRMLVLDDRYSEVIDLLETVDNRSFADEIYLCESLLTIERADCNSRALAAAERAERLATGNAQAAAALAFAGKALIRIGEASRARQVLDRSLSLDPRNPDACKRLASLDLAQGRYAQLLETTARLEEAGAKHARLFAAKVLAQAGLGQAAAARRSAGDPHQHRQLDLSAPPGWPDMAAFNAALAREILSHPGRRMDRYGSASNLTLRVESPEWTNTPAVRALSGLIIDTIGRQVATMAAHDDPWVAAMPSRAFLRTWCVTTEGEGYEGWHVHQFGWMSGVYYIQVPGQIAQGNSANGCLAFGLPDDLAGASAANAYGERLVRPREGMLLTFPSHAYHRTYPHETGEQRICFAFDVRPLN